MSDGQNQRAREGQLEWNDILFKEDMDHLR